MEKTCPVCNAVFTPKRSYQTYCSKSCYHSNNKGYVTKVKFVREPNVACEHCGAMFYKPVSYRSKHSYCSRLCQNTAQAQRKSELTVQNCVCDLCGKAFHKKQSHIRVGGLNFCTATCKFEYAENSRVTVSCAQCGVEFRVIKSRAEKSKLLFCTKVCADEYQRRFYLKTHCATCGKSIAVDKTRQSANVRGEFFCSTKCANKVLHVGERNVNYKGVADITASLRHHFATTQRGIAFARFNKTCVECGELATEIHHIYPFHKIVNDEIEKNTAFDLETSEGRLLFCEHIKADNSSMLNDENNLIAVCSHCHDTIYHKRGWLDMCGEIDNQQPSLGNKEGSETTEAALLRNVVG